jgi:N utilization substance protein A
MRSEDLVSSFGEIARAKEIDRDTLQIIVEDVIRAMIKKRYGSDEAFEIIFNPNQGDIQILHIQEVVDDWDLVDPVTEIEVSDAREMDEDVESGDEVASEMDIADFGRRAVMTARQTFQQRIRDIEKEQIYEEYSDLIGEVVVGEIYQVRNHETLLMHEGTELVLPRNEQIPSDHYRKGNMLRTVVKEVRRDAGSDPQVVVSRTSPVFMERLFEIEVPEVYDGIVEIKKVARIPGDRAKVAVASHDDRVDPVGACVGVKGVRIHAVVRELSDENIDVMQWSDDPKTLIARALSPANPTSVKLNTDTEPSRARVEVPADEVSQAIGKKGVNIKLATQLTGYEIDVFREIPADEEDIDIEEFADELEEETIQSLRRIGCDTGKAVLELSADALARRAGLDRGTAERVLDIIETEFEKGPGVIESIERGKFTVQTVGDADESAEPSASPDDVDTAAGAEGTGAAEPVADAPDEAEASAAEAEDADVEDADAEDEEPEDVDAADVEDTETEDVETEDAEAAVEGDELDEEPVASGAADGAETDEEAVAEAEPADAEAEEAGDDDTAPAASETSPSESVEGSGSGTEPTADAPAEEEDETDPDTSTTAASDAVQESGVK